METLFQILQWALPTGGVGLAIGWLLSRNIRKTREAKEIHDTYKAMYEDVQQTLFDLKDEYDRLFKKMSRLERAVYRASGCRYWSQCPVRNELRKQQKGAGNANRANIRQPKRERNQVGDTGIRSPGDDTTRDPVVESETVAPCGVF